MHTNKHEVLHDFQTIEERLKELRAMIEDDTYCVDLLHQAYLIRQAIESVEHLILQGHLQGCVPEGIKAGKKESVIQELLQLYSLVGNR